MDRACFFLPSVGTTSCKMHGQPRNQELETSDDERKTLSQSCTITALTLFTSAGIQEPSFKKMSGERHPPSSLVKKLVSWGHFRGLGFESSFREIQAL